MTSIRLNEEQRRQLLAYARAHDVRRAYSVFDARGTESLGAVNIWSRAWLTDEDFQRSEVLGTIWLKSDRVEIEGSVPSGVLELLGLREPVTTERELAATGV